MCNAPERYLCWRFEDEEEEEAHKLSYTPDSRRPNGGQFVLNKEDHTLGNLLRMQLLEDKEVTFSGYRVQHPLEPAIQVKVQTKTENPGPVKAVEDALGMLLKELGTIEAGFRKELNAKASALPKQEPGPGDVFGGDAMHIG